MKVSFDQSFYRRLVITKDKNVLEKVRRVILRVEEVESLQQMPHIKKIEGFNGFPGYGLVTFE